MTASVFGPDRICAVIAAPTSAEAVRQLRSAMGLRGRLRVLELRLDYLRDAAERAALLRWVSRHLARQKSHRASYQLAHHHPETSAHRASPPARMPTILAACRTRRGGGQFDGSIEEEIAILAQAAQAGCLWCDVEIETAERLVPAELHAALAPARVLISAHDFRLLPPRLSALREKLFRCGGDAVKVAAACRSLADTRRLLALVGQRDNVIAIPMADKSAAEDAAAPRILALREGAALAYAAVDRTTAPGQLSLDAIKRVYHLNRVFAKNATANHVAANHVATTHFTTKHFTTKTVAK
ncbi:MAG TPA: type I 3-dehydroquinate dehydratase, partial [Candidatus Acidoferrales bacterium]